MLRCIRTLSCLLLPLFAFANNIVVSNVTTTGQNAAVGATTVQFDLGWENSWRVDTAATNWDAAWVFVKFRIGTGDWQHATLVGTGAVPTGATVDIMDGTGAMVYRAALGSGDVLYDNMQLQWDYTTDGATLDDALTIRVFAIEMVYVPEAAFKVGDGRSDQNQFYAGGTDFTPFEITSENPITIANTTGNLYYSNLDNGAGDQNGPLPQAFPKGYGAFYVQKYETSQQEWVDFFNTLPFSIRPEFDLTRATRYISAGTNKANNKVTAYDETTQNDISTTFPGVPVNYVDQVQALAYLDWAGLRPWTELELEKAARGTLEPISGGFAIGSDVAELVVPQVTNEGQFNSRITNHSANQGHFIHAIPRNNEANGPHRVGLTAASAVNFTRLETGASYYGILDISGNLWERIVTVGTPDGRDFVGEHGDGTLAADGTHNVDGWPAGEVAAFGIKGCAYVSGGGQNTERVIRCSISARRNAAGNRDRGDHDYALFRGVRSL